MPHIYNLQVFVEQHNQANARAKINPRPWESR